VKKKKKKLHFDALLRSLIPDTDFKDSTGICASSVHALTVEDSGNLTVFAHYTHSDTTSTVHSISSFSYQNKTTMRHLKLALHRLDSVFETLLPLQLVEL